MSGEAPIDVEMLLAEQDWLRALAHRLVADDARADDLLQDVWIRVLSAPPRSVRSVRAWLTRVLVNRSRDVHRSEASRTGRQDAVARADGTPSTADLVARVDAQRRVADAVLHLEKPVRETVLLRFFEDLPVREVARRTGVPYETARARLSRGLDALRAGLAERDSKGRRQWSAGFLVLAGLDRAQEAAAAAALTGAVVAMKTKLAVVAAVVVLLAVGVGGWSLLNHQPTDEPAEPAPEVVAVVPSDPEVAPDPSVEVGEPVAAAPSPPPAKETPDPERGAVHGRITLPDGKPAAGLQVRLSGRPAKIVTTDDYGRFRIVNEWVDPLGRKLYIGPANGMVDLGTVPLRAGDEVEFDGELPAGRPLDVEVVSAEDGRPLPGVWVGFDPLEGPDSPAALCMVDGQGKGSVEWLATRDYRVYIASRGYRPWSERLDLTQGVPPTKLRIALHDPEELLLRVTPPPEGKDLCAFFTFLPVPEDVVKGQHTVLAKMAPDGTARGTAPAPGHYRVHVEIYGVLREVIPHLEVREREPVEIRVEATSGVKVTGVLVDASGKPVHGVVAVHPHHRRPGTPVPSAITDEEGRFRLTGVPVGPCDIEVRIGRQGLSRVLQGVEVGDGGIPDLRVRLPDGQTLRGRIAGSELPNAHHVNILRLQDDDWWSVSSVATGKDGSFEAKHLVPGRYRVAVSGYRQGSGWAETAELEIRAGEDPDPLVFRWLETPEVEIHVAEADGRPVSGSFEVDAMAEGPTGPSLSFRGKLDDHGKITTRALAPGRYRLVVTADGRMAHVTVEVKEKDNLPIRVTLP